MKDVTGEWSVYIPVAGCDNGEPVSNWEIPMKGGAQVSCVGGSNADALPDRPNASETDATVEIGTVVVMSLSQQQVMLAADSRATIFRNGRNGLAYDHVEDNACKIAEINPHLLFAVTDMAKTSPQLPANVYYDAIDLAKEAAKNFKFEAHWMDDPNKTIKEIAARWAWDVAFHIRRGVRAGWYRPMGTAWVRGVFAGLEPNGEVSAAVANLEYHPPRPGVSVPAVSILVWVDSPRKDFTLIEAYGRDAIANKYLLRNGPEAARTEHLRIRGEQFRNPKHFSKVPVERLVELTDKEDDFHLPDGNKVVGGETDIARLRENGSVEWLRHKTVCSPQSSLQPRSSSMPSSSRAKNLIRRHPVS